MRIQGIGVGFARGRGTAALERALEEGWTAPDSGAYRVKLSSPSDRALFRPMRRADRFTRLAVLAARDAVVDSGVELKDKHRVGIIVASAFGPHVTTFKFLDDIMRFGDTGVSPTVFSHSVHNAAASYVAASLDIRGPTQTVTHFHFAIHHALDLARIWLAEGRCRHMLVGSIEECGTVMEYICRRMLKIAENGKIRPFAFSRAPLAVPGEGAVFYLLTNQGGGSRYCRVSVARQGETTQSLRRPDLKVIDADGMAEDESAYLASASSDIPVAAYSPLYGSMMTGSAFSCATAALMIRNQMTYPSPITENPHGIPICTERAVTSLDRIHCIKYDCEGRRATLELERHSVP